MKKDWEMKTIGDVCVSASSNVSQNKLANDEGDYPIFGASGLIKKVSFYHRDKPYLSIVKDGSGVGRITKMDAFTSVIGTLQYILPQENIDLNYLNYSLMSVDFKKYVAGAAIPHIYFKDYKNEPFLWMPLPEQQRIVAILDEAFAAIAKAKANAQQNLQNAKELFESYLQGVFTSTASATENKGKISESGFSGLKDERDADLKKSNKKILKSSNLVNPNSDNEGWEEKRIDKVCSEIFAGGDAPKDNFSEVRTKKYTIPIYANAVKDRGLYGYTDFARVTKPSITIAARGSGTGHTELRSEAYLPIVRLIVLIPNSEIVILEFLKYKIDTLDILRSGSAIPQLTVPMIKEYKIPIITLEEQQTIVRKLDILSAETKKLEAIYQQKINYLEELKKSVLQKAFSGGLN
ncbi:MAG: restriction endonuclease subunit S [Bacteroidia bacterium]